MTKQEAKEKIKRLIDRYEKLTQAEISKMNEATTRKDFIIPLFETLGWDVYNHNEVVEEQSVVEGAVDYSFKLNKITQFLLEAKALKIDLEKTEWAKQSVDYAWNMGVDWAVLTNFENLKLFNAEEDVNIPRPIKEFTYKEYLIKFEDLWILSKESFQNTDLDEKAKDWGIKAKRLEVTEKLAKDLMKWRDELFSNFILWNEGKYKEEEIDEAVQRILDRLIFIRSCEDKKIEEKKIWPAFQKWEKDKPDYNFIKTLRPIFKYYDETYNSNLFKEGHFCEKLDTGGEPFHKVINELYGDEKSGVRYNFAIIKPDILGAVYEQYLGHILRKSKKKNDADKDKAKRKEQGIYYTPTFIVDYIVENTLGKLVKEKSLNEIQSLKILDPACGSGSFLIKAFGVMDSALKELRRPKDAPDKMHRKYGILSNIYGVDLDEQAIEITRLNLLLKAIEPSCKLPYLSENTKVGNSLISGTEEELKKQFGKDWENKKAFNWGQEFAVAFGGDNPGFDVIVGNPPYVDSEEMTKSQPLDREYMAKNYSCAVGNWDLFIIFIERALNLLKNDGYLGFIVPNKLLSANYAERLRKWINDNFELVEIVDLSKEPVFKVDVYPIIIIIRKRKRTAPIKISQKLNEEKSFKVDTKEINWALYLQQGNKLLKKIYKFKELKDLYYINAAATVSEAYEIIPNIVDGENAEGLKIINTGTIDPYVNSWGREKMQYIKKSYLYPVIKKEILKPKDWYGKEKIIIAGMNNKIEACLDAKKEYLPAKSTSVITKREKKQDLLFLLALLNSKLLSIVFKIQNSSTGMAGGYMNMNKNNLGKLPIPEATLKQIIDIRKNCEKRIKLGKELQKTTKNSDKWEKIKSETEKTDKIIDQKVYELYGLTKEEIKIIEK